MKNKVIASPYFVSRFKKFSKKFPSINKEIIELESKLLINPEMGESLGASLFKIRMASKSKGTGKSGGFRVITYLTKELTNGNGYEIFLITIYDKSEESSIKKEHLQSLVKKCSISFMQALKNIFSSTLHLFYPHVCTGCGSDLIAKDNLLCLHCINDLPHTNFAQHNNNP
ncbi:MAG: hypothetical protein WDM90_16515 [Ferruginibacter sp.]